MTSMLLLLQLLLPIANACNLSLIYPAQPKQDSPIEVNFSVEGNELRGVFHVKSNQIYGHSTLGPGEYPYMFDVVEIFVTASPSSFPYYEFELSALGQTFQVQVEDLHQPFREGLELGMTGTSVIEPHGWRGEIHIPLDKIGFTGDVRALRGNAYGILGQKPHRQFFSAFMPSVAHPNFHQPQYFASLLNCSLNSTNSVSP